MIDAFPWQQAEGEVSHDDTSQLDAEDVSMSLTELDQTDDSRLMPEETPQKPVSRNGDTKAHDSL